MTEDEKKYPLMIELKAFTCGYSDKSHYPVNFQAMAFEFDALLAERDYFKNLNSWHDISVAPKDGTIIDLWLPDGVNSGGDEYKAHRCPSMYWDKDGWYVAGLEIKLPQCQTATHWKLYPEAPKDPS